MIGNGWEGKTREGNGLKGKESGRGKGRKKSREEEVFPLFTFFI